MKSSTYGLGLRCFLYDNKSEKPLVSKLSEKVYESSFAK